MRAQLFCLVLALAAPSALAEDAPPLTEQQARALIPAAAAMSDDAWAVLTKAKAAVTADMFDDQPLTVLVCLAPAGDLEERWPGAGELGSGGARRALLQSVRPGVKSKDRKLATEIHENYITACSATTRGSGATGTVTWRVPRGGGGTANFTAEHDGTAWQITAFELPKCRWRTVRDASGRWRIAAADAAAAPGGRWKVKHARISVELPAGWVVEVSGMSSDEIVRHKSASPLETCLLFVETHAVSPSSAIEDMPAAVRRPYDRDFGGTNGYEVVVTEVRKRKDGLEYGVFEYTSNAWRERFFLFLREGELIALRSRILPETNKAYDAALDAIVESLRLDEE